MLTASDGDDLSRSGCDNHCDRWRYSKVDGKRYRLLGFDSPETFFAKCEREREAGYAAAARLRELIETTDARLEPTGKNCKWGRGCAYLLLNGEDAGDVMIREGHGAPYTGGRRPNWCGS